MSAQLLRVENLRVSFRFPDGFHPVVDGVDLGLDAGQVLGLVGESGSGKSVTALTLLGLKRGPGTAVEGEARFQNRDLLALSERELQAVRGRSISIIFQDPGSSLNPVIRVGEQIAETVCAHLDVSRRAARRRAVELLRQVGIPHPERRVDSFPHEFSGGMRQRVMIAIALACDPEILIADEPTTALDVTVQAQVIDLLMRLREERNLAILLISHDLGLIARTADTVIVMYAGRVVEQGSTHEIFYDAQHPYTWGLFASLPGRPAATGRRRLLAIEGSPPSVTDLPAGCAFRRRCRHETAACASEPELTACGGSTGHAARCVLAAADRRRLREAELAR